ncbi:DUF4157 domain-containing protein [Streptomyces luteolifulvus]|jgi:hypothetical protein|uniref:DUF4157 domain-containing protein n=1 Tax=Streptomyces luteolifulvus TaxID=2615112 RepID=A0A6H9UU35_9ACTN|nr:DUF4157 domain-containing protein [Streptomyces luteolifulvus]KAB1142240.1 DUF4157 domain-containing protein [Streptomyces luteolifulvus]
MRAHEQPKEADGQGNAKARSAAPAASVLGQSAAGATTPAGFLALQRSVGNAAVVRMMVRERHTHTAKCGHPRDPQALQRRAAPKDAGDVDIPVQRRARVHDVLKSPGRPLAESVRKEAQSRMGADFSQVRVHDNSDARASAADIGARAYTSGQHVVLGDGGRDKHTLYHELAHVIQQSQGPVEGTDMGDGTRMSTPGDRHERQADAWAHSALSRPVSAVQRALAHEGDEAHGQHQGDGPGVVQRMTRASTKRTKDSPPPTDPPPAKGGRRTTRSSGKKADLSRPVLTFESSYDGVGTQRLADKQRIGFEQAATLSRPDGAPQSTAYYYHFWQEVRDEFVSTDESGKEYTTALGDWKQDLNYWPPYNNAVIDNTPGSITFNDNPGWSTDRHIESGQWLKSYQVSFRWKVAYANGAFRRGANGTVADWTSPAVTHTMTSEFDQANPDTEAPVVANAAGSRRWTVNLPAREEG